MVEHHMHLCIDQHTLQDPYHPTFHQIQTKARSRKRNTWNYRDWLYNGVKIENIELGLQVRGEQRKKVGGQRIAMGLVTQHICLCRCSQVLNIYLK